MPNPYARFEDRLVPYLDELAAFKPAAIAHNAADVNDLANTMGGRVLAAYHNANHGAANFANLFATFNNFTGNFTWDPSGKGAYTTTKAMDTLDGTRLSGECKVLAAALLGLWNFPAPFGLGQAQSNPPASLYLFENYDAQEGFISHHPQLGVRGLPPNIIHPHGNAQDLNMRQPLYRWGDHKVVFYGGRLWDPSYKCTWAHEDEMVAFQYTGVAHATDRDVSQVRVVTPNVAKGWLSNQIMYVRFDLRGGGLKGPYRDIV